MLNVINIVNNVSTVEPRYYEFPDNTNAFWPSVGVRNNEILLYLMELFVTYNLTE